MDGRFRARSSQCTVAPPVRHFDRTFTARPHFPASRRGFTSSPVAAPGFAPLGGNTIAVLSGQVTDVQLELIPSTSSLVVLGRVTTKSGEALTTSSVPSQELASQQFAASAGTSVADLISQDAVSITVTRPAGGNPAAPAVVGLRGPDPTETLVDVDGHPSTAAGPARSICRSLTRPNSPACSSCTGSPRRRSWDRTRSTARSTCAPGSHGAAGGSCSSVRRFIRSFCATLQATGTAARFGYAFSVHRTTDSRAK